MRRLAVIAMIASCGGGKPTPQDHPTLEPSPPDARQVDANAEVTAVAQALAPLAAQPALVIPQTLRALPFYVRDVDGLFLFDDEQAIAANLLATWARDAGFSVEDPVRTRAVFNHARRGEHAVTGAVCGAALHTPQAVTRWRSELVARGRIEARVQCNPTCELGVTVAEGLDKTERGTTIWFAAPYDVTRPWRTELPHAIGQLAEARDLVTPPRGATDPGSPIDQSADVTAKPLFGVELRDRVEHCVTDSTGVLVELDPSGRVTRCEGEDRHTVGELASAPCACKELIGQTFSDAKGRRRGTATFFGPKRSSKVHVTLEGWPGELAGVARCPDVKAADLAIDIDATGAVTKVAPAQSACVDAALRTLLVPCPAAAASVRAHLAVKLDP